LSSARPSARAARPRSRSARRWFRARARARPTSATAACAPKRPGRKPDREGGRPVKDEVGRMKDEGKAEQYDFHPSAFILHPFIHALPHGRASATKLAHPSFWRAGRCVLVSARGLVEGGRRRRGGVRGGDD